MPRALRISSGVVLFAAGALIAGAIATGGHAADTTTTETTTETTTAVETTTAPATTEITTATVEQTTTRRVVVPPPTTTTTGSSSSSSTPTWVWVVLGILAVGLVVLAALLLGRRGGRGAVPPAERRQRLDRAASSWAAQGWALESQTGDSAVLRRGSELLLVSVDEAGHVSSRPLPSQ
jgi:hypothetical protein